MEEVVDTAVAELDAAFGRWNRARQRYESVRRLLITETMTRIMLEHAKGIVERKYHDTQDSRIHLKQLAAMLLKAGRVPFSDEVPRLVLHWTQEGLRKITARQAETMEWHSTAVLNLDRGFQYLKDTIDHLRVVRAVRAQALRAAAHHFVEVIANFTRQHTWAECVDQLIRQGIAMLIQFDVSSPEGDGPSSSQQTSRIDFACLPSEYVTLVPLVKPLRRESGVLQLSSTPTLLDHPPPRVCLAYRDVHRSTRSRPSAGSSREGLDLLRFSETIQDEYLQNISATIVREDFVDVYLGHMSR
mmetsp:Transcript_164499/g.527631  ORF Transcript_164499/g.527631 Transcript_164499/m.527631 type:complete len:301 (+) Transcript_164499:68-970(+)